MLMQEPEQMNVCASACAHMCCRQGSSAAGSDCGIRNCSGCCVCSRKILIPFVKGDFRTHKERKLAKSVVFPKRPLSHLGCHRVKVHACNMGEECTEKDDNDTKTKFNQSLL